MLRKSLNQNSDLPTVLTTAKLDSAFTTISKIQQSISENLPVPESPGSEKTLLQTQKTLEEILYLMTQAQSNPTFYRIAPYLEKITPASVYTLDMFQKVLKISGSYYRSAKNNLQYPNPEQCLRAVQLHRTDLDYLHNIVPEVIADAPGEQATKNSVLREASKCEIILKDYIAFCQSKYLNHLDSLYQSGNHPK